ncbi:hypothetical protein KP509_36G029000 [Ceratopteris richardii]|nr:hypothetical protein KP509_36G029000 [Ceratopteris richardii]
MRMALPPDSMAALSVADEDLIDSRLDCELDGCTLHRRSFFKDTSEGSSSGSSDVSSSFAKTTESFESSTSKRSLGNRSGRGGSPFKYLSARMVAEKLIKVLGKEKMRPSIHKATFSEEDFQKPVICSEHAAAHAAHPVGLLGTAHTEDTDNGYFKNDKFLDIEDYSEDQQILEARALAKEELARGLDKENTLLDGKCKSRILEDHTADAMAKNLMFLKREVRKLRKDKKDLALEVAREIRARIFERNSAAEKEKHTNKNIEVMVSAIERDKDNLQEMLERELERRGNEWATKLEKMRTEESQMRERVKEMAEEKAELQKSLSAYKERETSWKIETMEYEHLLSTLQQRLEASEIQLERRAKTSVGDAERIEVADQTPENLSQRVSYLEMENAGMQKEIVRLRRACNDQEMTIEGLCQELDESVNGSYECRNESLLRLQRELLRLAGVEQTQRSEINAIYTELIGLKQKKNITHTGSQTELEKINQELQDRVHTLETKAADLQEENKKLCLNLRAAIRCRKDAERNLKLLQFKRTNKNMDPEELETDKVCVGKETDERTYPCGNGALQENLKALNSKLQSREAELKRLDEQIIEIVSSKDFLQMEVDDLHGKLLIANQHIRELEREVEKREVAMEVLRTDSERYKKELTSVQNELFHSRRQRDEMQKEAEDMSKEALRLTLELSESKKAAEKLEEEVMLKEGQISILRGTYANCDCSS